MVTLDPAKAGSRQPADDQIGNFLNREELAEKEQNLYGISTRFVTDMGSQPGMPSLQFQKAIGTNSYRCLWAHEDLSQRRIFLFYHLHWRYV